MAVMDIQVSPRRVGSVSVSDAVVAAHQVIQRSGLKHILHPMGTCVEGEPRRLYDLAAEIHEALAQMGFARIGIALKIDERLDQPQSMDDKLRRVEQQLTKY